ncbi:hypothetical protein [Paenibacillus fonticola]|uniref:hypothetical protein n=1 Tax=Paenibacillus fonticola TaxID=379896 RepID=UPI000367D7AB|nr:hypothetical protein [Paenibacillus fonticola]
MFTGYSTSLPRPGKPWVRQGMRIVQSESTNSNKGLVSEKKAVKKTVKKAVNRQGLKQSKPILTQKRTRMILQKRASRRRKYYFIRRKAHSRKRLLIRRSRLRHHPNKRRFAASSPRRQGRQLRTQLIHPPTSQSVNPNLAAPLSPPLWAAPENTVHLPVGFAGNPADQLTPQSVAVLSPPGDPILLYPGNSVPVVEPLTPVPIELLHPGPGKAVSVSPEQPETLENAVPAQIPPFENAFPFEMYPDPAFIQILSSENGIEAVSSEAGMAETDESV